MRYFVWNLHGILWNFNDDAGWEVILKVLLLSFLVEKGYSSRSLTAYAVKSCDWNVCCKLLWLFFRICDSGIYVWKKREVHIYNRWVYQVGLKEGMFHVHFRVVGLLTIRFTMKNSLSGVPMTGLLWFVNFIVSVKRFCKYSGYSILLSQSHVLGTATKNVAPILWRSSVTEIVQWKCWVVI